MIPLWSITNFQSEFTPASKSQAARLIYKERSCIIIKELQYRKAGIEDIELLVELRIEVLRAANQLSEQIDMSHLERKTREYYKNNIRGLKHITYLVFEDSELVGCGSICFYQVMSTYDNPTGEKAYIMNMYTRKECRRKGIASRVIDLLIDEARVRGISCIALEATEMGRKLYERKGFVSMKDEMELRREQLLY